MWWKISGKTEEQLNLFDDNSYRSYDDVIYIPFKDGIYGFYTINYGDNYKSVIRLPKGEDINEKMLDGQYQINEINPSSMQEIDMWLKSNSPYIKPLNNGVPIKIKSKQDIDKEYSNYINNTKQVSDDIINVINKEFNPENN